MYAYYGYFVKIEKKKKKKKRNVLSFQYTYVYSRLLSPSRCVKIRFSTTFSPQSSRQCVGLLDVKAGLEHQIRHQNKIQKVFLRQFPLSGFLAKPLRVNKIAMKSSSKNLLFEVDFKLQVRQLMYKINTHNISGVRNKVNNPD